MTPPTAPSSTRPASPSSASCSPPSSLGRFAVRSIAGEHSTGMIRTTFSALPNRRRVVVGQGGDRRRARASEQPSPPTSPPSCSGSASSPPTGAETSLGAPGVARAIAFGALAVSRRPPCSASASAGSSAAPPPPPTWLSVAIIGSQLFSVVLPAGARPYLPGTALQAAVTGTNTTDDILAPVPALLTLGAYAGLALATAMILAGRRRRLRPDRRGARRHAYVRSSTRLPSGSLTYRPGRHRGPPKRSAGPISISREPDAPARRGRRRPQ